MLVERIWTGNAYRNFNYLVACPESGEALAIDPLDHGKCLNAAKVRGWQITQVLNTHEHHDHTGGNEAVIKATGAKLLAHHKSGDTIRGVDRCTRLSSHSWPGCPSTRRCMRDTTTSRPT